MFSEKGIGPMTDGQLEQGGGKTKEKMSKAERRALQEEQRAAKAAAKASGDYFFFDVEPFAKFSLIVLPVALMTKYLYGNS